ALALRPDDGDLMLFAAGVHTGNGDFDRAAALLQAAEGRAARTAQLRAAAYLADARGEYTSALGLWQQVAAAEPVALDAAGALARLLADTVGGATALDHLRQAGDRFPHHYGLHQLWIDWLRADGRAATEAVVRQLIAIHPADAWARRELALVLSEQRRHEEA